MQAFSICNINIYALWYRLFFVVWIVSIYCFTARFFFSLVCSVLACLLYCRCARCVWNAWARRTGSVRIMLIRCQSWRSANFLWCLSKWLYIDFGFWCSFISHFLLFASFDHMLNLIEFEHGRWLCFFSFFLSVAEPISSNWIAQIFSHFRFSTHFTADAVFFRNETRICEKQMK